MTLLRSEKLSVIFATGLGQVPGGGRRRPRTVNEKRPSKSSRLWGKAGRVKSVSMLALIGAAALDATVTAEYELTFDGHNR